MMFSDPRARLGFVFGAAGSNHSGLFAWIPQYFMCSDVFHHIWNVCFFYITTTLITQALM